MKNAHKLLRRQIKQHLGNLDTAQWKDFLEAVDRSYQDFEADRALIERAMELSSQELLEANREMRLQNFEIQTVHRIATLAQDASATDRVMPSVLQEIADASGFTVIGIELFNPESDNLRLSYQLGFPQALLEFRDADTPVAATPSGKILEDSLDLFNTDDLTRLRPKDLEGAGIWWKVPVRSFVSVRLGSAKQPLGVLSVGHPEAGKNTPQAARLLLALGRKLSTIIERKAMHEAVRQREAQMVAEAKMSELGKMAGAIAHEINNPLAVIGNNAALLKEILTEPSPDPVAVSELLDAIESTVTRIADIISGLKTFSRDGSGDPFQKVEIRRLIKETILFCTGGFNKHDVKLSFECPEGLTVQGRGTQLSQVLLNLLSNALDAVASLDERWVRIDVHDRSESIEIWVTDSGRGISESVREKMFAPFFTTKEIGKGTGLGLSVSLGIVNAHQGELSVDTQYANTRFVLKLPK